MITSIQPHAGHFTETMPVDIEDAPTDESVASVRERVHALIQDAISSGQPLKLIRGHLKDIGVRFSYSRTPPGARERTRHLKRHSLCASGCGRYADWKLNELCFDCRAEAWK